MRLYDRTSDISWTDGTVTTAEQLAADPARKQMVSADCVLFDDADGNVRKWLLLAPLKARYGVNDADPETALESLKAEMAKPKPTVDRLQRQNEAMVASFAGGDIESRLAEMSLAISFIVQNQDAFSDEQALSVSSIYPEWHTGVDYRTGQIVRRDGQLYRVAQAHASQADWTPEASASLFSAVSFTGTVENWAQPTGAHDAYNVGDHVMHGGVEYVSLVNGNVWEPGTEASGTLWEAVA